jgi:hypothetical protein
MFKGKFVVLTLMVVAVALSWQMMPGADAAYSGIVDAVNSDATVPPGPAANHCWLVDPVGQGGRLDALGAIISVTARDNLNAAIPDIPASDFWLIGATDNVCLCGGSASSNADSVSNGAGQTTISGALRGGGCDQGVQVVIQSTVIVNSGGPLVLPITAVSPDIDCDLAVDTPDFAIFAIEYPSPPKAYNACVDYNCDGDVELIDFTIFAQHYLITC